MPQDFRVLIERLKLPYVKSGVGDLRVLIERLTPPSAQSAWRGLGLADSAASQTLRPWTLGQSVGRRFPGLLEDLSHSVLIRDVLVCALCVCDCCLQSCSCRTADISFNPHLKRPHTRERRIWKIQICWKNRKICIPITKWTTAEVLLSVYFYIIMMTWSHAIL